MAKKINQWSLTLLRIILGIIYIYHGYLKLFVAGGFAGTIGLFTKIGIPLPGVFALIVAVLEFGGGILLLIGLLTRWISLGIVIEMMVAIFKLHIQNGFLAGKNGYEFPMLAIAALIIIIVNGPGTLSIGKLMKNKHFH